MPLDETTQKKITDLISQHDVLLFMKGSPEQPQCGFSATTSEIIKFVLPEGTSYGTVDVLSDPLIRDGIKEFSNWPTIPQLFIKGEFVGGCDIVKEMMSSGEIYDSLGVDRPEWKIPAITITNEAAAKIRKAMGDDPGFCVAMSIDSSYRTTDLRVVPDPGSDESTGDVRVESNGITVLLDPISSQRADGMCLRLETSDRGDGLAIDNPNAP